MTSVPRLPDQQSSGRGGPAARRRRIAGSLARLGARWLRQSRPDFSSATGAPLWQLAVPGSAGLLCGAIVVAPGELRVVADVLCTLSVFAFIVLRSMALLASLGPAPERARPPVAAWPSYSVLVPLRGEARVLPGLVDALARLDYPRDRLEILLVLEADDLATCRAARAMSLPPWIQVVELPPCAPATKPKALAAALWIAKGELVTVYDAEDSPDPHQLRLAAEHLIADPRLGCVQARLVMQNADESWLARQLALEYAALFSGILPLLARLDAPVPLGGTSNHFRRSTLMRVGGWDPYNVTEDADLGLRMARFGYRVATIPSDTGEEAPRSLAPWIRQRTRWMKGWMQTWCVHMRHPLRLAGDLGLRKFLYLQLVLTGSLLCALVHPVFYVLIAWDLCNGEFLRRDAGWWHVVVSWVAMMNFALGYAVAALSMIAFAGDGRTRPTLLSIIGIPIYWLLISVATWRAAWKLVTEPFVWEKTPHTARPTGMAQNGGDR